MKIILSAVAVGLAGMCLAGCEPMTAGSAPQMESAVPRPPNRVVVYYMHRTLRCISCLTIEKMTRDTLKDSFSAELASGRLEFRIEDYWIQTDLARRYGVETASVVVVNMAAGQEVSHRNLDQVWSLKGSPGEFSTYISGAVREALAKVN